MTTSSARLAADHAVKGSLADPSPDQRAGVESAKASRRAGKSLTTLYTYGVRDDATRQARATYNKLNERQRLLTGPQLVDARMVLNACRYAMEAGLTSEQIAADAGVGHIHLKRLLRGAHPRMRRLYEHRLLDALDRLLAEQAARLDTLADCLAYARGAR